MNICIDVRSPGRSGVLTYTRCLLRALSDEDKENYYLLLLAEGDESWGIDRFEEVRVPSRNYLVWLLWGLFKLPGILRERNIDLYHTVKHITFFAPGIRKILTFHSARFLKSARQYRWYDYLYWRIMSALAARFYDGAICVSYAERRNYVQGLKVPEGKFSVTHLAAGDQFNVARSADEHGIFETYRLPERYILYVGRLNPVKNLSVLLEAIALARASDPACPDLVIVGHKDDLYESLLAQAKLLGISDHVRFTGPIYEDLPFVYQHAFAFVLPSSYEAFPQVPLEAMASGTPVIASDRGGIPEVVGDAGLLVEPEATTIAGAIGRLISSASLRKELREKGLERAKQFSWQATARRTVEIYQQTISAAGE